MKIDKVMHRNVQIIGPNDNLRNAAAMMKKLDAGALPVGEHDKLVGMITDRDIAIRGVAEGKGTDATVQDVMNRDKRLVGIVALGDLAIQGSLPKTARALHEISQPAGQHNQSHVA